jgi:hypothetical protein
VTTGRSLPRTEPPPQSVRLACELVVPLRWVKADPEDEADLATYLHQVVRWCEVTVVDGSPGPEAAARRTAWPREARVLQPDARWAGANGKVTGAMTGIEASRHPVVVLADDDVRYGDAELSAVVMALRGADLVVPQNVPTRWPWWVWWESGRVLLNRALAVDWPGTVGCRRDVVLAAGGWSRDVLFENLEMARTVEAAGGSVVHRPDILVPRRPPPLRHFMRQRVRQAYEDAASPVRWGLGLITVPVLLLVGRRLRSVAAAAAAVIAVAEAGRRRAGARAAFPPWAPFAAPLWALERGVCSWVALVARLRGGAPYHGRRLSVAAHSTRELRQRLQCPTSPWATASGPWSAQRPDHAPATPHPSCGPEPTAEADVADRARPTDGTIGSMHRSGSGEGVSATPRGT